VNTLWIAAQRSHPKLLELEPATRELAAYMLATAWHNGVPLWISSARRSEDEQRRLVAEGRSRTLNSAHLRGEAFDVDIVGWNRNDVPTWFWSEVLGPFGESLGLVWGGRWTSLRDHAHFELPSRRIA
jgi:peptidoglycan L-alanyl-D-glutamate endopeptidase CwlK